MKEKYRNVLLRWGYIPPSGLIEKLHALRYQVAYSVLVDYCQEVGGREANIVGLYDWLTQQEEE